MFKFYFELWGVQKDVLAWWCWGGDIGGDAGCDVGLVTLWKFAAVVYTIEVTEIILNLFIFFYEKILSV